MLEMQRVEPAVEWEARTFLLLIRV